MRRSFAFGIWLMVTLTATVIVWTAVSVVAADVTDRPAPVVAHRDVVVALAGSAPGPGPVTITTTTIKPATPPTAPRATTVPPPRAVQPSPPVAPFLFGVTTTVARSATPTTIAIVVPPPTTQPPVQTTSYSTDGGVVTVACTSPFTIRLVSATPNDGFLVIVTNAGPGQIEVNLLSQNQGYKVSAVCFFGKPVKTNFP